MWTFSRMAAPVSAIINRQPRVVQDQVWRDITEAAGRYRGRKGDPMENEAICVAVQDRRENKKKEAVMKKRVRSSRCQ